MWHDLRDAQRSLCRRPRLTLFAVAILTVAFTATGLVAALVNGVLLRPFPFPDPDRLVLVWDTHRTEPDVLEMTSISNYLDYRSRTTAFEEMAAWQRPASMTLIGDGVAEVLSASVVTTTFFSVLGRPPAMGRDFLAEDGNPGSPPVTILSHELWQRRFGAAPDIVGRTLLLDEVSYRVIGIAPKELESPLDRAELWVPMTFRPNAIDRGQNYLRVLARVKEGSSLSSAQAEMDGLGAALGREFPATNAGWAPRLVPLADQTLGGTQPVLLTLLGGSIFLLLISVANVSNLQLVSLVGRQAEFAVRRSLGASRGQLLGLVMIEQAGVALAAAGLSVAAIPASFPLLSAAAGPLLPRSLGAGPDASTIGVTLGLGFLASALFALPAALYVSRLPTSSMVGLFSVRWGPTASAPRSGTGPPLGGRLRRTLAIAQLALSLALLIGSALIAMTLLHLGRVPLGFRAERLLVLRLALGDRYQDEARRIAYFRELQERLRSLPSVRSAGAATVIPMSSFGIDFDVPYYVPGAPEPERARAPKARFRSVTPGGLEALGTARLEGRGFTWEDDGESPRVIIVNRALAQRIWGNESPLGKELRFFWADWQRYEVVGVVEDSRSDRLTREAPPQLFVPYAQYPYLVMNVVVESSGNPEMLAETAREAVLEVDPLQPVNGSSTMVDLLAASTSRERLAAFLLGALASAALFLSLLGIYATLSFSMERRKREIGIRAALGASPRALLKWALEEGATATLAGIGLGLIISAATTDRLSDLLFGVGARDPWTFVAATAFLFATSMLSCYFAVRRTLSIDPALAIRAD